MALRILQRDNPSRAIALIAPTQNALIFQPSHKDLGSNGRAEHPIPQSMVEFVPVDHVDLSSFKPTGHPTAFGTLGLINIGADIFICIVTSASEAANVRSGERVLRILAVDFCCINRSDLDNLVLDHPNHGSSDAFADHADQPDPREHAAEHPCLALKKLLSDGTFYYSLDFDLTNRLQNRTLEKSASTFDVDSFDDGFLWNSYMTKPLIQFRSRLGPQEKKALDDSHILTSAIRGYVSTITVPASSSPIGAIKTRLPSSLSLISRLSCRRAGTRFNSRGIDDDGNVSNFVETETIYWYPSGLCFSYSQVRGSVPIFWEQQAAGILPPQQKIQITRSPEATQSAFNKHFEALELKYGSVHVLNLLSNAKPGEVELTSHYNAHIQQCPLNQKFKSGDSSLHSLLQQSQYDFHAETRDRGYEAASTVRFLIQEQAEAFAYFLADQVQDVPSSTSDLKPRAVSVLQQGGVFRTNCLDCLDRTNLVQTIISQMALELFFAHRGDRASSDFWMRHSTLWADNGDALSKIYAGTGALRSSFTRHGKMSFAGALADARKSATRLYMTNFVDKGRQAIVDTLLGRLVDQLPVNIWDPVNDFVSSELSRRADQFVRLDSISIWTGTFNLNGKGRGTGEDLSAWLFPQGCNAEDLPHIVAVGFQEIVELSPQQIMSTDPARRLEWELAVSRTLNNRAAQLRAEDYVLLRSGQLVGAALMIFVKRSVLPSIKNVEGSVKKTGLNGIAGNKGGVAIRIDFATTRLCFVTAHLAAGFANYDERNRDYHTIAHGLRFQRNRSIDDHDAVIWLGDFNYRIGLSDEKVRKCIFTSDLGTLYHNDQLNIQMVAGHVFPYYAEAKISFPPTYKYNNGTDEYDTSEKARIPAYCDRIISKGDILRQIGYDIAPLRFSDHRPVYATFRCTVRVEDEAKKDVLSKEMYKLRRAEIFSAEHTRQIDESRAENLAGAGSTTVTSAGISTERQRWWLDYSLGAKSEIAKQHQDHVPNPRRLANPFSPSLEPDWLPSPTASGLGETAQSRTRNDGPGVLASSGLTSSSAASAVPSTMTQRKPAPPVPTRKPVLGQVGTAATVESGFGDINHQLSERGETDVQRAMQPLPPLPNRRGKVTQEELDAEVARHTLSTKLTPSERSYGPSLIDENSDKMSNIPALEPAKRGAQ